MDKAGDDPAAREGELLAHFEESPEPWAALLFAVDYQVERLDEAARDYVMTARSRRAGCCGRLASAGGATARMVYQNPLSWAGVRFKFQKAFD